MPSQADRALPPGGVAAAKGAKSALAAGACAAASASLTPEPHVPAQAGSGDGKASSASSAEVQQLDGGDVGESARTLPTVVLTTVSPTCLTIKHEPHAYQPQSQPQSQGSPQPSEEHVVPSECELRVMIDAKERLRWSPQLHSRFCQAVAELGGCAFAKPKDIVTKMNVPGLTLAHVKSHLQKYRQQEGVTYVPHGPRGGWGRRSSPSLQAPIAGASNAAYGDWQEGPVPKRMRATLPAYQAAPAPAAPAAAAFGSAASLWPTPHPAAPQLPSLGGAPAEPLQQYMTVLSGAAAAPAPLPLPPPMPLPAAEPAVAAPPSPPVHEAHADRLHALADLALAQQQELAEADAALQAEAAAVESVQEQLAVAQPSAAAAGSAGDLVQRVDALSAEQHVLAAELQRHLAAQAGLLQRLTVVRRTAHELLAHPELAQQAHAPAATQAAAAAAAPAGAPLPAGTDLNSLMSMVAAAAAGYRTAGQPAAGLLPQLPCGGAAGPNAAAAAGLAQLQHLYQNAALLAARQG